jgi:hypothetical protein
MRGVWAPEATQALLVATSTTRAIAAAAGDGERPPVRAHSETDGGNAARLGAA